MTLASFSSGGQHVKLTLTKFFFVFFCSLLKSNGSLLAFAGSSDKEARVTAAIASSIWSAYHSNIKQSFHTESLNFVLMDCDVCCYVYLYLFCLNTYYMSTHM